MNTKSCTKCMEVKDLDEFVLSKESRDGRRSECRACKRAHYHSHKLEARIANLSRVYGLTFQGYTDLLNLQNYSCAICGAKASRDDYTFLSVDHNHQTGKVRGLLCRTCNAALGGFGDTVELLEKAIEYLETNG